MVYATALTYWRRATRRRFPVWWKHLSAVVGPCSVGWPCTCWLMSSHQAKRMKRYLLRRSRAQRLRVLRDDVDRSNEPTDSAGTPRAEHRRVGLLLGAMAPRAELQAAWTKRRRSGPRT